MSFLDRYSPGTNLKQRGKEKKDFEHSVMGILRGEKGEVVSFKVNKTRSYVRLQIQRDSLHRRVVSPRVWILQTRTCGIITSEMFTMISHYDWSTGPDLWHTWPTREVKLKSSEDTYEGVYTEQKDNEFERQSSLVVFCSTLGLNLGKKKRIR